MDSRTRLNELNERGRRVTEVRPDRLPYHERLRGRAARNPIEIGWRGWCDIFVRVYQRIALDNLGLITAGVTFYVFLALIPAMIALVSCYGIFTDKLTLESHVGLLAGYLPDSALDWMREEISRVVRSRSTGLTLTALVGFGVSLWSMNNGVIALFGAMNIAYGEVEKRGTIKLYATAFAVTLSGLLIGLLLVAAIVVLPLILGSELSYTGRRLTAPALFVVILVAASAIYRIGPSRRRAKWRWIGVGASAVAALWLATATLLSWYLSNVANYAAIYGSLGTVIALMFWFYISFYLLLLGAELSAEVEHQTMMDTTVGPELPMGKRGAYVADTVGKSCGI